MSHTQGPWAYAYTRIGHTVRQSHDAMSALLVVNVSDNPEADARLIAAAPDLLAALQSFVTHGTCFDDNDMSAARDAIAKATGGQP
jgi:hypothetical protein